MERSEMYPCSAVVDIDMLDGEHRRYQIPVCNMLAEGRHIPHKSLTFKFEVPDGLDNWAYEFVNRNKKEVDE